MRLFAVLAVAFGLVLPAPAHAASPCMAGQLKFHLGRGDGAAGHIFYPLEFTNVSGTACTLRGYPGVSSVTSRDGRQLGPAAAREHHKVTTVLVRPRGKATALLDVVNADNFEAKACRPERASGFRVYAPGLTRAFYAVRSHRVCTVGKAHNRVRPVSS